MSVIPFSSTPSLCLCSLLAQIIGPPRSNERLGNYVCLSDLTGEHDANCQHQGQLSRPDEVRRRYGGRPTDYTVPEMLRVEAKPLGNWTIQSVSEAKYLMKVTESATQPAPATSYQPEAQAIAVHDRAEMSAFNKRIGRGANAANSVYNVTYGMPRDPSLYYYFVPHRLQVSDYSRPSSSSSSAHLHPSLLFLTSLCLQPTDCIEVTEFRFNKVQSTPNIHCSFSRLMHLFPARYTIPTSPLPLTAQCGAKMNKIVPLATVPPGREQPLFPGLIHFAATDPMSFALLPSYDDVTQVVGEAGPHQVSELHNKMGSAAASKAVTQISTDLDLEAKGAVKDDLEAVGAVKDAAGEALEERSDRKSRDVLKRMGFRKCSLPDSLYEVTCPPGTTPKQRCALMLYVLNEMAEELA